jgi:hypothetical protein
MFSVRLSQPCLTERRKGKQSPANDSFSNDGAVEACECLEELSVLTAVKYASQQIWSWMLDEWPVAVHCRLVIFRHHE